MTSAPESSAAKFYKCALQVNPNTYIRYRGEQNEQESAKYNQDLLNEAIESNIAVVGLADHGSVDESESLRELLKENKITVFPGFEISSSEKIHFVCLFDENKTKIELDRILGRLDILDPEDGICPSKLSAQQIIEVINSQNGFIYAAHCTNDNGLLKVGAMNHIWRDPKLLAAQIPGSIEDLKGIESDHYRKVILNKVPEYRRERKMTVINASDVCRPSEISKPNASCLVKMTKPNFYSFKQAFYDGDSRVRLNSEKTENYASAIERIKVTGGYLDGLDLILSENLNSVIGGRGTGKSTLIECIRFALNLKPFGKDAEKQHTNVMKENLGYDRGTVSVSLRSAAMHGRTFKISRKYGDDPVVRDEYGEISPHQPTDLIPKIELFGQNEIYEIVKDQNYRNELIERFLDHDHKKHDSIISDKLRKLKDNRENIINALNRKSDIETDVARLPKLEDKERQYKDLGLDEKLKIIPSLETEKGLSKQANSVTSTFEANLKHFEEQIPSSEIFKENAIKDLPHENSLRKYISLFDDLRKDIIEVLKGANESLKEHKRSLASFDEELFLFIDAEEKDLESVFKKIPASQGKSGKQIGEEYKQLLADIAEIKPKKNLQDEINREIDELYQDRKDLLQSVSEERSNKSASLQKSVKRLNKRLKGKIRLTLKPEANRDPLLVFVTNRHLERVGPTKLKWIIENDFSPISLASMIRRGEDALSSANWGMTPTVSAALSRLTESELLEMEEQFFLDTMEIELNVAHGDQEEHFRGIDYLSTGQQCTAILHLLLLDNDDPLILDQPEDNLDNAFIADRIVAELRRAKLSRQFLFATHNANIPVFGDAEWIGVFTELDGNGVILPEHQGAVDSEEVQKLAADILEGGESAFNQRREKYGFS